MRAQRDRSRAAAKSRPRKERRCGSSSRSSRSCKECTPCSPDKESRSLSARYSQKKLLRQSLMPRPAPALVLALALVLVLVRAPAPAPAPARARARARGQRGTRALPGQDQRGKRGARTGQQKRRRQALHVGRPLPVEESGNGDEKALRHRPQQPQPRPRQPLPRQWWQRRRRRRRQQTPTIPRCLNSQMCWQRCLTRDSRVSMQCRSSEQISPEIISAFWQRLVRRDTCGLDAAAYIIISTHYKSSLSVLSPSS